MATETPQPRWYLAARTSKWHRAVAVFDDGRVLTVCRRRLDVTAGVPPRTGDAVPKTLMDGGTMCKTCRRNGGAS